MDLSTMQAVLSAPVHTAPAEITFEQAICAAADAIAAARAAGRRHAMAIIEAGRAAAAVKEALLAWEQGPDGRAIQRDGWVALCSERLGCSYKTADRYIADWEAYAYLSELVAQLNPDSRPARMLALVEAGEVRAARACAALDALPEIEAEAAVDPRQWAGLKVKPGPDLQRFSELEAAALDGDRIAAHNLARAAAGEINLGRAYAGWCGGQATEGKVRRDPDYGRLLARTAITAKRGWAHWYDLDRDARSAVLSRWVDAIEDPALPEEIARETLRVLQVRYGGKMT
jgi:hypothetical protein